MSLSSPKRFTWSIHIVLILLVATTLFPVLAVVKMALAQSKHSIHH